MMRSPGPLHGPGMFLMVPGGDTKGGVAQQDDKHALPTDQQGPMAGGGAGRRDQTAKSKGDGMPMQYNQLRCRWDVLNAEAKPPFQCTNGCSADIGQEWHAMRTAEAV